MSADAAQQLPDAISNNDLDLLRAALDAGADPNLTLWGKKPALSVAAERGQLECIDVLLGAGADINLGDKSNRTPLFWAARGGKESAIRALLEKGADPNICSNYDGTPLIAACEGGYRAAAQALVDGGADLEIGGPSRRTALSTAAMVDQVDCLELLLEAKASTESTDDSGRTPLMQAADAGTVECTRRLVDAGAKIDARCKTGRTALMYAAWRGQAAVVELLLERGADPSIGDTDTGLTAAGYALDGGSSSADHLKCAQLLGAELPANDGDGGVLGAIASADEPARALEDFLATLFVENDEDKQVLARLMGQFRGALSGAYGPYLAFAYGDEEEGEFPLRTNQGELEVPIPSLQRIVEEHGGFAGECLGGGDIAFPAANDVDDFLHNADDFPDTPMIVFDVGQNIMIAHPTDTNARGEPTLYFIDHEDGEAVLLEGAENLTAAQVYLRLITQHLAGEPYFEGVDG